MLCVFLACHNLPQLSETYKKLKPLLLVLIFDYPFFSAHQEPGIKAHMLNRVSFHPITRAKRPQAF